MSDEPRTRHLGADELTRVLQAFADDDAVAARPIRVTREASPKQLGDPATALGLGVPRRFEQARASIPSPRVERTPARVKEHGLRAWHAWLAAIVLAGFALGGLIALSLHTARATARVPPATLRLPPALPAGTPVISTLEVVEERPKLEPVAPLNASRRSAVDALLAGRTRVALEHYRRVLAQPSADHQAIEGVVKLLARELRSCEQEAGTPCGF
ncbi:MAG TPA: hypothetical protein VFX59_00870 [Polyangiales bacterium]|nr:hypothetical protein [Polyangiales bacterium]